MRGGSSSQATRVRPTIMRSDLEARVPRVSSLALYRTYRPGRFADVVGQDHVTGPLTRHWPTTACTTRICSPVPGAAARRPARAFLPGPSTASRGPLRNHAKCATPCRDLAPNGPGSIDVVELDAATHGLVDDARDLREKAHFTPISSRFKIYIIDEVHQLGPGQPTRC